MLKDQLKEAAEDADCERALKDVAVVTTKDRDKIVDDVERRVWDAERVRVLVE